MWERGDFPSLVNAAEPRRTSGTGACHVASPDFFWHVRGYDEKYLHWGAEDADMVWRARRYGLEMEWMEGPSMVHQWHSSYKYERPVRLWFNRLRYRWTRWMVVKNFSGWGASSVREAGFDS